MLARTLSRGHAHPKVTNTDTSSSDGLSGSISVEELSSSVGAGGLEGEGVWRTKNSSCSSGSDPAWNQLCRGCLPRRHKGHKGRPRIGNLERNPTSWRGRGPPPPREGATPKKETS